MAPTSTLLSLGLTLTAYLAAGRIHARWPSTATTPVFVATAAVVGVLLASDVDYDRYRRDTDLIVAVLGPATAALAVPLYRHRRLMARYTLPALLGLVCGATATLVTAVAAACVFRLAPVVIRSIGIKSVTTPIAIELARLAGGDASLTSGFVVATGMIGATLGPWLLDRFGVTDPVARGLALGTVSQGLGTARAALEGEVQGAVAAVAMASAPVFVSLWAPALLRLIC